VLPNPPPGGFFYALRPLAGFQAFMYASAQTALDLDNKLFLRFELIALDREVPGVFSLTGESRSVTGYL